MLAPKPIKKSAVPAALEKALRYRLLNEPLEAESICRDVLAVDANNQEALATLLLALTDQFKGKFAEALAVAKQVLSRLDGEYERAYYEGIIHERWAKAQLSRGLPPEAASNWFREALGCYERAQAHSPTDEADAILRWNTCVRILEQYERSVHRPTNLSHDVAAGFGDDTAVG